MSVFSPKSKRKDIYSYFVFKKRSQIMYFKKLILIIGGTFRINALPNVTNSCRLLITFAKSLDIDQARQNVGPDLDPNCLTL